MFHILRRPTAATLIQRQLAESDRLFLDAVAAAEFWAAQAAMLARRRARLQGYLEPPQCSLAPTMEPKAAPSQPEGGSTAASPGATSAPYAAFGGPLLNSATRAE